MEIQIHHEYFRGSPCFRSGTQPFLWAKFPPTARPGVGLLRLGQRLLSVHDQMAPCSSGGACAVHHSAAGIGLTRRYPAWLCQAIAIENDHRTSGFSHE